MSLKSAFGVFNRFLACWSQIGGLRGAGGGMLARLASHPAAAAPGRRGWQQLRGVCRDARPSLGRPGGQTQSSAAPCRLLATGFPRSSPRMLLTGQGSRWHRRSTPSPALPAPAPFPLGLCGGSPLPVPAASFYFPGCHAAQTAGQRDPGPPESPSFCTVGPPHAPLPATRGP